MEISRHRLQYLCRVELVFWLVVEMRRETRGRRRRREEKQVGLVCGRVTGRTDRQARAGVDYHSFVIVGTRKCNKNRFEICTLIIHNDANE